MDYEIAWTEPARTDLRSIVAYISQQNPAAAERVADAILSAVDVVRSQPRLGAFYTTRSGVEIRELLSGKYRIFYSVDDERQRVEVLTVWHSSRQEPRF